MTKPRKYHNTGFIVTDIDCKRTMWRRELDTGEYYAVLYEKAVRPIVNGTGIRYCVAYHGGSENYWEFTTHEAAMKRVRELVYGVARKLNKKERYMSDKPKSTVSEAAKTLGAVGGKKRTAAQARARRENGKSGGRPKGSTNK